MADAKGSSGFRNSLAPGKQAFLPPKAPLPTMPPSYADYSSAKGVVKPREGLKHHQRASSENFLIEEQPSWLDELLNEPETPVRRGAHRRASSDSFAYLDVVNLSFDNPGPEGHRHRGIYSVPSWGSGEFDYLNDMHHNLYYGETDLSGVSRSRGWMPGLNKVTYPNNNTHLQTKEKVLNLGLSGAVKEPSQVVSTVSEKQEKEECSQDHEGFEKKEGSHGKHPLSEMDTKRAKQQFAQRSRVRKLQYIAELERNVQALQAEGLVFSAELEFLNQQNLMLDLENKALKQRLDSLEQEHVIKCLQHEMLEREIARLRALLFHQQQQQQQPSPPPGSGHSRRNSRDLDSQFANLSLKHKEANSGRDPVTGSLRI